MGAHVMTDMTDLIGTFTSPISGEEVMLAWDYYTGEIVMTSAGTQTGRIHRDAEADFLRSFNALEKMTDEGERQTIIALRDELQERIISRNATEGQAGRNAVLAGTPPPSPGTLFEFEDGQSERVGIVLTWVRDEVLVEYNCTDIESSLIVVDRIEFASPEVRQRFNATPKPRSKRYTHNHIARKWIEAMFYDGVEWDAEGRDAHSVSVLYARLNLKGDARAKFMRRYR